jgi:hypothetical protein
MGLEFKRGHCGRRTEWEGEGKERVLRSEEDQSVSYVWR